MKLNSFTEDIPIMIIIKAMGMESDMEFLQFINKEYINKMHACQSLRRIFMTKFRFK